LIELKIAELEWGIAKGTLTEESVKRRVTELNKLKGITSTKTSTKKSGSSSGSRSTKGVTDNVFNIMNLSSIRKTNRNALRNILKSAKL
jgi:hypothetical protein